MKTVNYEDLTKLEKKLLDEAEKVMENSYNPYSNFFVGAAILAKDGSIYTGTNRENAAYSPTFCAEVSAISKANSDGKRVYKTIAITARGKDFDTKDVSAPCGRCRQDIFEYSQLSDYDIELILSTTKKDKIVKTTISELLPLPFGPKDLGIDVKKYQK